MRIFWLTNVKPPVIYEKQVQQNQINIGGWLDRISRGLLDCENIELMVCYPYEKKEFGTFDNLSFQSLLYDARAMRLGRLRDGDGISEAKTILKTYAPDVIHIQGTEFQYHYYFAVAAKALGYSDRVAVSIQGMVGVYAKHLALGLPASVVYACTVREIVGKKNVRAGISNFLRRGKYEKKTIEITKHILGRTTWDRACTHRINPDAVYHTCNETLREAFYSGNWSLQSCVKHRIFISQASYPVKGFHLFLGALTDIKQFFPNVTVHVAGADLTKGDRINGSSYALYIRRLMKEKGLSENIHFCGNLNAEQMKQEMLEANVFVSPSTIENSPNSVGEAMLLGVPVVSSNVGGVSDLLKDKEEGFLYQSDAPYMLAYYVMALFRDNTLSVRIGQAAKKRASETHDYKKNLKDLLDIYEKIVDEIV